MKSLATPLRFNLRLPIAVHSEIQLFNLLEVSFYARIVRAFGSRSRAPSLKSLKSLKSLSKSLLKRLLFDSNGLYVVVSGTVFGDSGLEHADTVSVASGLYDYCFFLDT